MGQVQKNRGTQFKLSQGELYLGPGKEIQRYTAQSFKLFYFSDLLDFLMKIDQGTKVHRYRGFPLHTDLTEIQNQCEVKSV